MNSIHDPTAMELVRKRLRIAPEILRRLRKDFYKKQATSDEMLECLPESERGRFSGDVAFHSLTLQRRHDSRLDGASKLLFQTAGGDLIESVILRIASGRTSLCVSSQVGCAVRCQFCATGQMGSVRNLSRDEILDQVIQANQMLRAEGRAIRNVVFMGMGEPLFNEAEVYSALDVLISPHGVGLSPARVIVSTIGIPDAMVRCAKRFPRVGIALSLHSARQSQRENLIPIARRYPLDMLRQAMEEVTAIQCQPLMVEYLMLEGVNDADGDLSDLIAFLRGLQVHVNLIPFNAVANAAGLIGTTDERRREFAAALTSTGFTTTVRYSLGADIAAACGQLVQLQTARPSPTGTPAGSNGDSPSAS